MRLLGVTICLLVGLVPPAAAASGPLLLDAAIAGDAIVAVGERGTVLRSTDDGASWTTEKSSTPFTLCAVSFADAHAGWAAGHGAVILHTQDGGLTWSPQFTGPDPESPFLDLLALSPQHVIAIGAFGSYFDTRDGGAHWTQQSIADSDAHLNRISRTPAGTLFVAGEMGMLLRSTDDGETWQTLDSGDEGSLYGVLPLRDGNLIAYGLRGRVYRSTDQGDTWTPINSPATGLLLAAIEEPTSGHIIVTGQARTWWTSRDHGLSFKAATDANPAVAELLLNAQNQILTFGEAGATLAPSQP